MSGVLFAGDAVGVKLPDAGVLRPSTPPPDFDLVPALHSLRRFADRRPTGLALAHYGLLDDPLDVLDEADGTLRRWADVAEAAFRSGVDIAAALSEAFASDLDGVPDEHRREARGHERRALQRRRARSDGSPPVTGEPPAIPPPATPGAAGADRQRVRPDGGGRPPRAVGPGVNISLVSGWLPSRDRCAGRGGTGAGRGLATRTVATSARPSGCRSPRGPPRWWP